MSRLERIPEKPSLDVLTFRHCQTLMTLRTSRLHILLLIRECFDQGLISFHFRPVLPPLCRPGKTARN